MIPTGWDARRVPRRREDRTSAGPANDRLSAAGRSSIEIPGWFVGEKHGLDWKESQFVAGSSLLEMEESARQLAEWLEKERGPEHEPGLLERAAIAKIERKRELLEVISGRAQQREQLRDAHGASPAPTSTVEREAARHRST